MIYKRKVYNELLDWKNSKVNNSALLIEGARRIGKSTIVEEFAKNEFDDYILIDFMYETEEMMNLFKNIKNLDLFFSNFFLLAGKTLKPGSLIIFDEIQKCPLARQAIKKLVKDGRYYYIETGSLLSIRDNTDNITIPSEERRIEMYPLDYEEFLWAFGDESTANLLRSVYANNQTLPEGTHKELMKKFRLYMVLGGMPKVISIFQETNSYMEAEKEKQDILKLYKDDLLKHDRKYGTHCRTLYDNLANELMSQSSRFNISKGSNNKRIEQLKDTIFDLDDSKIVKFCYHASEPQYGLDLSKSTSKFKMYSCDAGLLVTSIYKDKTLNVEDIYKKLIFGKINSNFGKIFESIISQALISNGYTPFYHTYIIREDEKEKHYEIDFMFERAGKIVAIEVKSGSNFTTSSLNNLKIKYPQLKFERIVISNKTLSEKDSVRYLPIYMAIIL